MTRLRSAQAVLLAASLAASACGGDGSTDGTSRCLVAARSLGFSVAKPRVNVESAAIDFGVVRVGTSSTATVTAQNVGELQGHVRLGRSPSDSLCEPTHVEPEESPFTVVRQGARTGAFAVPAGGSIDLAVIFRPWNLDAVMARLVVSFGWYEEDAVELRGRGG